MSYLKAGSGWTWLKEGAGMFRKQPAGLTTLLFADILISVLIGVIPFLGAMLAIVLVPCFSMAFMQACLLIDQGKRVTPDVLLTGFRQPAVKTLLKVGLVYLAVFAVLAMVMHVAVDPDMKTGKAVFYSFFAVLRTGRAFVVLLLSWFAILFSLCILVALLLGPSGAARIVIMWVFFLFFLLLQCALYAAYRQIFGTPAAQAVSLTKV